MLPLVSNSSPMWSGGAEVAWSPRAREEARPLVDPTPAALAR